MARLQRTHDVSELVREILPCRASHRAVPILFGKISSLSRRPCAQFISASTYSGAGSFVGRLNRTPSSHRYSYLMRPTSRSESVRCGGLPRHAKKMEELLKTYRGPADIIGHWSPKVHPASRWSGGNCKPVAMRWSSGGEICIIEQRARLRTKIVVSYLLWRAELCYGPIQHVEMIEEIDRCPRTTPTRQSTLAQRAQHVSKARTMDREPLVEVLALGKLHREAKVARSLRDKAHTARVSANLVQRDVRQQARGPNARASPQRTCAAGTAWCPPGRPCAA